MSYCSSPVLKLQQLDATANGSGTMSLSVPFEAQTLQVEIDIKGKTLGTITKSLKDLNKAIEEVDYYTLDGAVIPECELLKDRNNIPFIMSIKREATDTRQNYSINLNESFSISSGGHRSKISEEAYLDYCLGIGLPKYSSFLLSNFASKLHQAIPQQEKVDNATIMKSVEQTMSYFRSVGNHNTLLKVCDIEHMIDERQTELIKMNSIKAKLDRKADFRSRSLLTLGSSIFFAQFGFVMSGTFVFYSWDVMEPISYMILLGNLTVGLLFYANYKNEMQLITLREILTNKFAKGLYRR